MAPSVPFRGTDFAFVVPGRSCLTFPGTPTLRRHLASGDLLPSASKKRPCHPCHGLSYRASMPCVRRPSERDASRLILRTLASRPTNVPLILRFTWAASLPAGSVRCAHSGRCTLARSKLASLPSFIDWPGPSQARPFHATGRYQAPTLHGSAMPTAFLRGRVRAAVGRVQQVPTDVVNQSLRSSRSRPSVWVENRKPGLSPREAFSKVRHQKGR